MKKKNLNSLQNESVPKKKLPRKYCGFCKTNTPFVDYKNADFLSIFLNPQAKILPRKYTGNCAKHQKRIASAVKKCRHLALMPYVADNLK